MTTIGEKFTVTVEGSFDEAGVWVVDTRVRFSDDLSPWDRADLVGDARIALLGGIMGDGARGRSLGASRVRLHLDDPARQCLGDTASWPGTTPLS